MKFPALIIQNFLTIGEAELSLSDRGLVLVSGQNDLDTSASSNGAGKSTIADALSWCLYGTTARGESGDNVVNNIAGKNCSVTVEIEDGGDVYSVRRYRKHKTGKNAVHLFKKDGSVAGAVAVDLTKGTDKLTQIEIDKVLGCTHDVFCASIYAGQDQMPDLPGMTDRNLKTLVEEAAGTTILERAYELARERLSIAKVAVDSAAGSLARAIALTDTEATNLTSVENEVVNWNEQTLLEIAAKLGERNGIETLITAQKAVIALTDKPSVESKIDIVNTQIAAVSKEIIEERRLSAELSSANVHHASLRAKAMSVKTVHDATLASLKDAEHKIGCPCDECGRPLTATEIQPLKDSITKKILDRKSEFNALRTQVNSALGDVTKLTDSLETFRASMTDTTIAEAQRASLYRELNAIKDKENGLANLERDLRDCEEEVRRKRIAMNPYARKVEDIKKRIVAANAVHEACDRDHAMKQGKLELAELVSKVFSPTGARGQILDEVTPYLNDKTATYLGTMSDGNISATWTTMIPNAKGELREKFGITVESATGGKSFGLLSGGEKRKVRIAAALALQDLVSTRATKQIELFIGDEIDNALDAAGIERLMTILEEKARERGSVFVISHSDLKDWISQQMTVIKDASGVSRIEETTS